MTAATPLPAGGWKKILDSADQRWLGPGSLVPEEIASNGRIELPVTPYTVVLLGRVEEADDRG
jgi:maltooligosyltrehalose trehalohydrolase